MLGQTLQLEATVTDILSEENIELERKHKAFDLSMIPPRYAPCSFENFQVRKGAEKAFEAAREWAGSKDFGDRSFSLIGTPGVGKTHLAVAAIKHQIYKNGLSKVRFLNVPIFLDRIRASFKFQESEAQELFEYCCKHASVVVLDDFGKEKATDWATERLYVLVESRYQRLLPTIMTSNRTLDELDVLGYGAAVSRLQQTNRFVRIDSQDLRPELGKR